MHLSHLHLHLTMLPVNHCALFIRSAAALWLQVPLIFYKVWMLMKINDQVFSGKVCAAYVIKYKY